jgi:hypothetical protein
MLLPTTTIATKEIVSVKVMPFIDLSDNDIYYLSKQENVNNNKIIMIFIFLASWSNICPHGLPHDNICN